MQRGLLGYEAGPLREGREMLRRAERREARGASGPRGEAGQLAEIEDGREKIIFHFSKLISNQVLNANSNHFEI